MLDKTLIMEIKEEVQKYADVISNIIGIDVEVMDSNFIRVAGTGKLKEITGKSMKEEAHIYKKVLYDGVPQIILNPGKDPACHKCIQKEFCYEKLEVSMPIKMGQKTLGVIGLVCFSEEQRVNFIKNKSNFLIFLKQISEFIVSKVSELIQKKISLTKNESFKMILNKISEGIILLDENNQVLHMNNKSMTLFNCTDWNGEFYYQEKDETFIGKKELYINFKGRELCGIGEAISISPIEKLLIFKEKIAFEKEILQIVNSTTGTLVENFLFVSNAMKNLYERITKIAKNPSTVLITGESGTGKEVIARTIHMNSNRKDKPFVAINCGAIPEALLESELFGYVKGAFTGADPKGKIGKFELANGGTLFLDEIGDMPLYMQVKLLRVLQEKKIIRIGSNQLTDIDVRIITATNKNLEHLIEENKFREDLFYRLNVIPIEVPPLRERTNEIETFLYYFAKRYANLFSKNFNKVETAVIEKFKAYSWPGNVRELENTVEYMVNLMGEDGILSSIHLPNKILRPSINTEKTYKTLKEIELEAIYSLLREFGETTQGKKKVAEILGIGMATLYRKLES
jgi:transcriptional regulator with PAS, ATPase and Fis domain